MKIFENLHLYANLQVNGHLLTLQCDKVNNVTVRYDEGYILQTNYMHNLKTYLIERIHVVTFNSVTIKSWFQRTKTKL